VKSCGISSMPSSNGGYILGFPQKALHRAQGKIQNLPGVSANWFSVNRSGHRRCHLDDWMTR
jgi:hypothetical protein